MCFRRKIIRKRQICFWKIVPNICRIPKRKRGKRFVVRKKEQTGGNKFDLCLTWFYLKRNSLIWWSQSPFLITLTSVNLNSSLNFAKHTLCSCSGQVRTLSRLGHGAMTCDPNVSQSFLAHFPILYRLNYVTLKCLYGKYALLIANQTTLNLRYVAGLAFWNHQLHYIYSKKYVLRSKAIRTQTSINKNGSNKKCLTFSIIRFWPTRVDLLLRFLMHGFSYVINKWSMSQSI